MRGIRTRRLLSRPAAIVLATAALAVVLRSFVYLLFEQLSFDSDQAITGLMAKHLAERRAFPLFFYGQTYMLAVEAWAAAPFFVIAGPSVAALRASLLVWNLAFAWLLIATLRLHNRISAWLALVPALVFVLAPPSIATDLMNAQGAIVEPFVYVAALWLLRRRPLWFGAVLGIGFRNREFVAYAVPALLIVELAAGAIDRKRITEWLAAAVAFAAVLQAVEALKPYADVMGPGTHGRTFAALSGSELSNLRERFDFAPGALPGRARELLPQIVEWFSGARQVNTTLPIGSRGWLVFPAAVCLALLAGRVLLLLFRAPPMPDASWRTAVAERVALADYALYLTAAGTIAIIAFVAGKPVLAGYSRYVLLGLLTPIGLIATFLILEPSALARRSGAVLVVVWALMMAVDHVAIATSYIRYPDVNVNRVVAETLASDGTANAIAGYWRAYVITFYARERVRVASWDFVRIQAYQDEIATAGGRVVAIADRPCPGGRAVSGLFVCGP
jgi:hypothetical protein